MMKVEHAPPAFVLRRCAPVDAADLATLGARLFMQAYGAAHPEPDVRAHVTLTFDRARLAAELATPQVIVYLAEDSNREQLGYAYLRESGGAVPAGVDGRKMFEIVRFYVDTAWHGRGVAGVLMAACVREARERGGDTLWLDVWQEAARPIAFYRRQGFRIVGTVPFAIGSRTDTDYIMVQGLAVQGGAGNP